MKLDIPCAGGRLQITDTLQLQEVSPRGRIVWTLPVKSVGSISSQRKAFGLTVTITSPSVTYTMKTISNKNYEQLQKLIAEYQQQA